MIKSLEAEEVIEKLESWAFYFAKLSYYFEEFYKFCNPIRAITSIVAGYDEFRNSGQIQENSAIDTFIREWILFLLSENGNYGMYVNMLYKQLMKVHLNYQFIPMINCNLIKYHLEENGLIDKAEAQEEMEG